MNDWMFEIFDSKICLNEILNVNIKLSKALSFSVEVEVGSAFKRQGPGPRSASDNIITPNWLLDGLNRGLKV